jgi:hypothetical protein
VTAFGPLVELWTFGDRREIPLLMNCCVDALRKIIVLTWKAPTSELKRIYEQTTPESALRRLIIHDIAKCCDHNILKERRALWLEDAV